jgi:hypothetical protein
LLKAIIGTARAAEIFPDGAYSKEVQQVRHLAYIKEDAADR